MFKLLVHFLTGLPVSRGGGGVLGRETAGVELVKARVTVPEPSFSELKIKLELTLYS